MAEPVTIADAKRDGWDEWIQSEADLRAMAAGCRFDVARAEHARAFFRDFLRLTEGHCAGQPFELQEWQWRRVIGPTFGWVRWSDHFRADVRRFDRVLLFVAKKNGKSPLAAAIGLYMLCVDGEQGGKVFSAATDREQARIVHNHAVAMVDFSERLTAACKVHRSTFKITHKATRSTYTALSSESRSKEGLNANCIVIDELHVVDDELWKVLRYAFASRAEPLLVMATTAGDASHGVCRQQYNYGKSILDGTAVDHGFLPVIFEAERDCDIEDENALRAANPSLGVTVVMDRLKTDAAEAKQHGASAVAAFRRYRLNQWVSAENPWLNMDWWNAGAEQYNESDLIGQRCFGGLDLSKTHDLTAFALVFPDMEAGTVRLLLKMWIPEQRVNESDDSAPWRDWVDGGHVIECPGRVIDYAMIKREIRRLDQLFQIECVSFDEWNATATVGELDAGEFDANGAMIAEPTRCDFAAFRQTIRNFAEPCRQFDRLVTLGAVRHPGNPCLTWQAGNVSVYTDPNENMRPVKPGKKSNRKIDGMVATLMGFARTEFCTHETGETTYQGDGSMTYVGA